MVYTYNELLNKYKSAYQIERAVNNFEIYKIEKGIPEHKIFGDSFSFVLISSHFFNGLFFNNRRQMFIK